MLRHFGQDPTPQEIMRTEGPAVYEWVARMWNCKQGSADAFMTEVPSDAAPMLQEIAETHLVQLRGNADAYANQQKKFDLVIQGCQYRDLPVSRYRVYCLEQLRREFSQLSDDAQVSVKALLPYTEAEILWQPELVAESEYDVEELAPFNKAINVYGRGTPD